MFLNEEQFNYWLKTVIAFQQSDRKLATAFYLYWEGQETEQKGYALDVALAAVRRLTGAYSHPTRPDIMNGLAETLSESIRPKLPGADLPAVAAILTASLGLPSAEIPLDAMYVFGILMEVIAELVPADNHGLLLFLMSSSMMDLAEHPGKGASYFAR